MKLDMKQIGNNYNELRNFDTKYSINNESDILSTREQGLKNLQENCCELFGKSIFNNNNKRIKKYNIHNQNTTIN